MSQENTTEKTGRRKRLAAILIGAAAILVAFVAIFAPTSGADFTASDTGRVEVGTATLSLNLSDPYGHSGEFKLNYANVKPGDVVTKKFYIKNTGTIAATAKIGQPLSNVAISSGLTTTDAAKLKVGFMGSAPASVTSLPSSVNLGTVNPGQVKTVTVTVELDSSAGNEWQGKTVAADGTVTLTQS